MEKMTDEDLRTMVRELKAAVSGELDRFDRRIDELTLEMRTRFHSAGERIKTVELGFAHSLGDMGKRLEGLEVRLERVEDRLGREMADVKSTLAVILDRLPPTA